jgi:hypothetical protein
MVRFGWIAAQGLQFGSDGDTGFGGPVAEFSVLSYGLVSAVGKRFWHGGITGCAGLLMVRAQIVTRRTPRYRCARWVFVS